MSPCNKLSSPASQVKKFTAKKKIKQILNDYKLPKSTCSNKIVAINLHSPENSKNNFLLDSVSVLHNLSYAELTHS